MVLHSSIAMEKHFKTKTVEQVRSFYGIQVGTARHKIKIKKGLKNDVARISVGRQHD